MCLAIMKKGPLRAKGVALPNKRDVIASQRRGNPGGGGMLSRFLPNLRWGIPLYFEVAPIYLNKSRNTRCFLLEGNALNLL